MFSVKELTAAVMTAQVSSHNGRGIDDRPCRVLVYWLYMVCILPDGGRTRVSASAACRISDTLCGMAARTSGRIGLFLHENVFDSRILVIDA